MLAQGLLNEKEVKAAIKQSTINKIKHNDYVLITYHNPYFKRNLVLSNDSEFYDLLVTRLEVISHRLANTVIVTPAQGLYTSQVTDETKPESSFMISFITDLSLADKIDLVSMFSGIALDLGQESFIMKLGQDNLLIDRKGRVMMSGQGVEILDSETRNNYTEVNDVKFTLKLNGN